MNLLSLKPRITIALLLAFVALSYYVYSSNTINKLEVKVENQELKAEVAKDKAKTEVLETKWETIAQEHNKSLGDKHEEIKEPVEHNDTNTTDFFFFGMFGED